MAYLKQRRSTVQMRSMSRPTGCHESVPQVAHQAISQRHLHMRKNDSVPVDDLVSFAFLLPATVVPCGE
jgi:hypothetical protein